MIVVMSMFLMMLLLMVVVMILVVRVTCLRHCQNNPALLDHLVVILAFTFQVMMNLNRIAANYLP